MLNITSFNLGDCVIRKFHLSNNLLRRGNPRTTPSGIIIRTYQGVISGYEHADPDGLNPMKGQVQVSWSSGAVENILEEDVILVDRSIPTGYIVIDKDTIHLKTNDLNNDSQLLFDFFDSIKTSISHISDSTHHLFDINYEKLIPLDSVCQSNDSSTTILIPPYTHQRKGLVIFSYQSVDIRLLTPIDDEIMLNVFPKQKIFYHLPIETVNVEPYKQTDLIQYDHGARLDLNSNGVYLRDVRFVPGLVPCSYQLTKESNNYGIKSVFVLTEGRVVRGFGWLGIISGVQIRYNVQLDGGTYFSINYNSKKELNSCILRPDPRQPIISSETIYFFPSQRITIPSKYITGFRQQLTEMADMASNQKDDEKHKAIESWLKDVTSTHHLSHGEIISFNVIEVHVRWLWPIIPGELTIPRRFVKSHEIDVLSYDLGQPVILLPHFPIYTQQHIPHITCLNDVLPKMTQENHLADASTSSSSKKLEQKSIGVIDHIHTTVTVLWDNGDIETNISGSQLISAEWFGGHESMRIELDKLNQIGTSKGDKELLLQEALKTTIFHPHSIVRRIKTESQCDASCKVPFTQDISGRRPNITLPYDEFKPNTLDSFFENHCQSISSSKRFKNYSKTHQDLEKFKIHFSSMAVQSDSDIPRLVFNLTEDHVTETKKNNNCFVLDSSMDNQDTFGFVVAVDELKKCLLIGWVKNIEQFFEYKQTIRQSQLKDPCLSLNNYPFYLLKEIGLCVCPQTSNGTQYNCPAYIRNTSLFNPYSYSQWQERIYKENHLLLSPVSSYLDFRVESMMSVRCDFELTTTPGLFGYPTHQLMIEMLMILHHERYPRMLFNQETAMRYLSSYYRFFCFEILAFVSGSVWIKMGDHQIVHCLLGEIGKTQCERLLLQIGLADEWSLSLRSSLTNSHSEDEDSECASNDTHMNHHSRHEGNNLHHTQEQDIRRLSHQRNLGHTQLSRDSNDYDDTDAETMEVDQSTDAEDSSYTQI